MEKTGIRLLRWRDRAPKENPTRASPDSNKTTSPNSFLKYVHLCVVALSFVGMIVVIIVILVSTVITFCRWPGRREAPPLLRESL